MPFRDWVFNKFLGEPAWVSAICALLSLICVVLSYLAAHRNRPEASIVPMGHVMREAETLPASQLLPDGLVLKPGKWSMFQLRNIGDGPAYMVQVRFQDCDGVTAIRHEDESFSVFHGDGMTGPDDDTWLFVDLTSLGDMPYIDVHWITPPTRLGHCLFSRFSLDTEAGLTAYLPRPQTFPFRRMRFRVSQQYAHYRWHHPKDPAAKSRHPA